MKWFHHECTATDDPKLQSLVTSQSPYGIGIFWMLLEKIGQHSNTFCLKVTGIDLEADQRFNAACESPASSSGSEELPQDRCQLIPKYSLNILARAVFTSPPLLKTIIATCVEAGLFDHTTWLDLKVLYSPDFEQSADDYTRRIQRRRDLVRPHSVQSTDNSRTDSEQSQDTLRTKSNNVPSDQNRREKKRSDQTCGQLQLSTTFPQGPFARETDDSFSDEPLLLRKQITDLIVGWNEGSQQRFDWHPTQENISGLLSIVEAPVTEPLILEVSARTGRFVVPQQLLVLAVRYMLEASTRKRTANPMGWLTACLTHNGPVRKAWLDSL